MIFRNHLSALILKDLTLSFFVFLFVYTLSKELWSSVGLLFLSLILLVIWNMFFESLYVVKLRSNSIHIENKNLVFGKKSQELCIADIALISWKVQPKKTRLLTNAIRRMDIVDFFLKDDSTFRFTQIGVNLDQIMEEIEKKYKGIKIEKTFI